MDINSISSPANVAPIRSSDKVIPEDKIQHEKEVQGITVSISEEANSLSAKKNVPPHLVELDHEQTLADFIELGNTREEQSKIGRDVLDKLDRKSTNFIVDLEKSDSRLARVEFDFSIRENGTLQVVGDNLLEADRQSLEKLLNDDKQIQNLADDLKQVVITAMSKEASAGHSYDNVSLKGIAINEKTISQGLHFKFLIQTMKSEHEKYSSPGDIGSAFTKPLYNIAEELYSNLRPIRETV